MAPVYEHDCDVCTYVDSSPDERGHVHDFYTCKKTTMGSVIARYGDQGYEYQSGPARLLAGMELKHDPGVVYTKLIEIAKEFIHANPQFGDA